jgi:hypothetical protein
MGSPFAHEKHAIPITHKASHPLEQNLKTRYELAPSPPLEIIKEQ